MLKLLITLIFISIPAFAVDAIYAWGYGEDIRNILISIKFFTANATYLIDIAIAIGILLVMYKDTQENNTDRIVKVVFLALVVSQLFFHTKKDYMVEDEVSNQAFAVTDIPIGIGELFSLFTTAERVITKAFESSYSTPNSLNYSQVGLGFSMAAHLATNNAMFIDGNAHETFMDYTTNCVASGMIDGQINRNLIASENIVANIRVTGFETLVYKQDGTIVQMSCQDSYDNYILNYFQNESNSYVQNRIAAQMSLDPGTVDIALQDTSTLFFGISKSGKDYVMQQMGRNMLKKGLNVMAMTTGGDTQALAYSSALSSSTMENQWQQAGMMTQSTLPMIKAYLTSLILAITPLIALLSIMFADWKYIKMIITLLSTLMLFSPLASVINYLMYLKLEEIIPTLAQGLWMPMLAMKEINSQIYSYINFLGYAAMSIPLLAYSLVKASEQGFVNFMSSMGGTASAAANTGAGQKVTGTNIGNTKVGGGSHTGISGTTTDMGGGSTQTNSVQYSSEGAYTDQTTKSSNGNTNSTLSNSVADITMQNDQLSSIGYKNLGSEITTAHQNSYNEAKATESSSLESMSNTLSTGLSTSMAQGQIFTNSDDFSKNTGLSQADSRTIVDSQNEAIVKTLNSKLSESQSSSTTADAGFKLGGHVGWDAKDTFVGKITGVSAGANGNFQVSGTSSDGKNFNVDMSKDEMANVQKSVSDNLSKTFNQDSGLALRTSESLANNQVFSNSSLKSDMDAYTKAHSIAEKYSENYSKTDSDSISFASKIMPEVTKQFIQNDDRLKGMYESGDLKAAKNAVDEASKRIDKAYTVGVGTDFNNLNNAFKNITGFDAKGNISDEVNNQIDKGKDIDSNASNVVSQGQNSISNTNVNNSINQNPTSTYKSQSDDFKESSIQDMNKQKEYTALNTEKAIDKGSDILNNRRNENDSDSRVGKAFVATTAGGFGDIKKGIENLKDLNKDTAYLNKEGKELPSKNLSNISNPISELNNNLNTKPNDNKNIDLNASNNVSQGQNSILNTNVNNSINQNPSNESQAKANDPKDNFIQDNKQKENTTLNTEKAIGKDSDILNNRRNEKISDNKPENTFISTISELNNNLNTKPNDNKNIDLNASNNVSQGQNSISNTNVNNSINQTPPNESQAKANDPKDNFIQDNKQKENTTLNTEKAIGKDSDILNNRRNEKISDNKPENTFISTTSGGNTNESQAKANDPKDNFIQDNKQKENTTLNTEKAIGKDSDILNNRRNENISDNKPENTFISTTSGGNIKDLKQDENKQFSSKVKDTKGLDSTLANNVSQGQNSISNTNVNNSINQTPSNESQAKVNDSKDNFIQDNKQKENTTLNTEKAIGKDSDILNNRRNDNDNDSRVGKAFVATTAGGFGDIKKGIENLKDLNKDTAYLDKEGKELPSKNLSNISNPISELNNNLNTKQNENKNIDSNTSNVVSQGQNGILNTNVNNSINQNPSNESQAKAIDRNSNISNDRRNENIGDNKPENTFISTTSGGNTKESQAKSNDPKDNFIQDNKQKENTTLNTEKAIGKDSDILNNRRNENISDNKPENTFISTTAGGNIKDLKQDENKQFSSQVDTKGLDSTLANVISQGQNSISNTNVNNSINQNPTSTYKSQSDDFKESSIQDINKQKENTALNTEKAIGKDSDILNNRRNENISDNKPENTFTSTISGGNIKDLKQDENKQFSSQIKDTKGLDSTLANVLYQGQNGISNYGINDIQKGIENLNELYTLRMQGNNEVSEVDKSINKNPINKGELADVKTQLEYLKDDISEITYANTQPLDKKGNKK